MVELLLSIGYNQGKGTQKSCYHYNFKQAHLLIIIKYDFTKLEYFLPLHMSKFLKPILYNSFQLYIFIPWMWSSDISCNEMVVQKT